MFEPEDGQTHIAC